jgi:HlyD family type I secretion membrane fusion protein
VNPAATAARLAERNAQVEALAAPAANAVKWSGRIAILIFLVFVATATLLPIASGAVAVGQLAVGESRQVVQHPTGGVVAEILVSEGDSVALGQPLLRLEGVQESAAAGVGEAEIAGLRAELAVREAEVAGRDRPSFPADMVREARSNQVVAQAIAVQRAAFNARRERRAMEANAIDAQRAQLRSASRAAVARAESARQQLSLVRDEAEGIRTLYERGLAPRTRLLALERAAADLEGQATALDNEVSRLANQDSELRARREQLSLNARAEAADALRMVQTELSAARSRETATLDAVERTEITAPMAGAVVNLNARTVGGVVAPGEPILEIVPDDDAWVVRARLRPQDVDAVRPGLTARIRLTLSGDVDTPRLTGEVLRVSADALEDPRSGMPYFEATIALPPEQAALLPANARVPGLPAEVLIETGQASVLSYLFSPITDIAFRAMRES